MEIGGFLQYYMLNTVINFLFKNFIALFTNFHAIRSWNFRIFAMRWWPRFLRHPVVSNAIPEQVNIGAVVLHKFCP